jgi:hypothetical protein
LNPDFKDILLEFSAAGVEYLLVGAYALAVHGVPRATGDIDLWVNPTPENAGRVYTALVEFGAPLRTHAVSIEDFSTPGVVFQIGVPPRRIDILTDVSGLAFTEAWENKVITNVEGLDIYVIGKADFIKNKR